MRVCSCSRVENREKSELCEKNERYGRIFIEEEEEEERKKKQTNVAHSNIAFLFYFI